MRRRSETGRGRLSSLLWLVVFAEVAYAIYNVGPVYYAHWIFRDQLQEVARTPRGPRSEVAVAKGIEKALRKAELGAYLDASDVHVTTGDVSRTISFEYEREAKIFPGVPHTFHLSGTVDAPFF